MSRHSIVASSLACAGLAVATLVATPAYGATTVLASGLNNPRGIAFAPNGWLFVAEAGNGGSGPCGPSAAPPFAPRCYGESGAVSLIAPFGVPGFWRVVKGLPSTALANGQAESGPAQISFHGMAAYVTMAWGGDPRLRSTFGRKAKLFGNLLRILPFGHYMPLADVAAHEVAVNPAGGPVDSNPYGVIALPARRVVTDAGANAVLQVGVTGKVRTLAVLPPAAPGTRDPVPTSVTQGPDGALYVGQLTGFPFFTGSAAVWRLASDGSSLAPYATGFTAIVGVDFDAGGALYVLETATGQSLPFPPPAPGLGVGQLVRQCRDGSREVIIAGLDFPGGVAIGPDGDAYVTNHGTSPTTGEVLRVDVEPCD